MTVAPPSTPPASGSDARRRARLSPTGALLVCLGGVLVAILLSLTLGARSVPFDTVWESFVHPDGSTDQAAVLSRVPTTVAGLLVGGALGMGGALMQGMARNPLADPGLLGVNSGAALFVVLGMATFGWQAPLTIVWCALAGAAVALLLGYGAAAASPGGATPVTLALAGAAVTAIATAVITGILIVDESTLDSFRFWQLGSLTAASGSSLAQLGGFLALGAVLSIACSGRLNALALGDDVARGLGVGVGASRLTAVLAVVLLCGTATALAGPIGFVGLAVPHAVRFLVGADYRWLVPLSASAGAVFLLVCDVAGRLLARPGVLEVGIVTGVIGAPVFIALLRRRRAVGL
ncbi:iron chelate uptake ABC transporter family permease subunit [Microbacterium resistens]|uniref:FecCD family ABC transporter permease n=1 Tax=Microbacterium resistens TaxID=156977 RepID=UPI001C564B3C|nr:iron chelate uptake ABC transporter family permease subunit [Microbacterium resistens]MBW1637534.1 iron chelate uptake ABC transporter family permease subunit [Microbacterium resistens]